MDLNFRGIAGFGKFNYILIVVAGVIITATSYETLGKNRKLIERPIRIVEFQASASCFLSPSATSGSRHSTKASCLAYRLLGLSRARICGDFSPTLKAVKPSSCRRSFCRSFPVSSRAYRPALECSSCADFSVDFCESNQIVCSVPYCM